MKKMLLLLVIAALFGSCGNSPKRTEKSGQQNGTSELAEEPEQPAVDVDDLMKQIETAGRNGDAATVMALDRQIAEECLLTVDQSSRFFELRRHYQSLLSSNCASDGWWVENPDAKPKVAETPKPKTSQPKPAQNNYSEPELYYFYCRNCHALAKTTYENQPRPNSGQCTKAYHSWDKICKVGTAHVFYCSKCGLKVHADSKPLSGNSCVNASMHNWVQSY
ncbi:MAG: hypothetical protein MJ000_05315 [Bacteroidales bacterium]|nr:hypothetical protein [Bacteroidales bacterium]